MMSHKFLTLLSLILITLCAPLPLWSDYPEIKQCSLGDPLYKQLQEDISLYYKAVSAGNGRPIPRLKIFQYSLKSDPGTDLFQLAAQMNLPYDTIVSLNHITSPGDFDSYKTLLIPNMPGLFIPELPSTELEQIMVSWRLGEEGEEHPTREWERIIVLYGDKKEIFFFLPGIRFHPVERTYFLAPVFIFPLPRGRITSSFGIRKSPFASHIENHQGIDIGAPQGTDVFAVRDGNVTHMGYNELYGNYVLISHEGGYQSFYGHLKDFSVNLYKKVCSGMVIGHVGMTGRSTGPHLHFEIRKNGNPKDPLPFFREF
jgi:hypothetical protein